MSVRLVSIRYALIIVDLFSCREDKMKQRFNCCPKNYSLKNFRYAWATRDLGVRVVTAFCSVFRCVINIFLH